MATVIVSFVIGIGAASPPACTARSARPPQAAAEESTRHGGHWSRPIADEWAFIRRATLLTATRWSRSWRIFRSTTGCGRSTGRSPGSVGLYVLVFGIVGLVQTTGEPFFARDERRGRSG